MRWSVGVFALLLMLGGCGGSNASTASMLPQATPTLAPVGASLEQYNIDPSKIYVVGISSGASAAVQMDVAHSATFHGAAIYAGSVYWCAGAGGAASALENCGGQTLSSGSASYHSTLAQSEAYLDQQSSLRTIDPSSNLAGKPVYLWSGTQDSVVNPLEMADLDAEYTHYGATVFFDNAFPAEHGWESPDGEVACGTKHSPYMIACDRGGSAYDSVGTWLTMFLGALAPRNNGTLAGTLTTFDQTAFGASSNVSMSQRGYIFVPQDCASGAQCGLILALHGCLQEAGLIGRTWVTEAGINEWADTNHLVVLYPDTIASASPGPTNPEACFDWWGYSNHDDPAYALKSGAQMRVLYAIVQGIAGVN